MIFSKWGRIIFFSSTGALRGDVGTSAYSASKTALYGLSKVISKEYGKYNITSNIISLGYFESKMWSSLNSNLQKKLLKQTLNGKLGDPSVIFDTIKLIVKHSYINMSKIDLDGGMLE